MTRLHPSTVNGLSLAVGVASLTIGLVSLLTTPHAPVPHPGNQGRPPQAATIVMSTDHREHPGHGVRIRFLTSPTAPGAGGACAGGCPASRTGATIRD